MADTGIALEQLRTALYPDGQERVRKGKTLVKVSLDDLADYLAEHPAARIPTGKAMYCGKCGRLFAGGEFRVLYQAGAFCRYCYDLLALAPLSARCIHCKQKIAIDDWRYKLWAVTQGDDGDLQRYYVHQGCESEMKRLPKAA
jgi:hypothetical protein